MIELIALQVPLQCVFKLGNIIIFSYWFRCSIPLVATDNFARLLSTKQKVYQWRSHLIYSHANTFVHYICINTLILCLPTFSASSIVIRSCVCLEKQRKRQSPRYWPLMMGIHRWPVDSPHKRAITQKRCPFDDEIISMSMDWMTYWRYIVGNEVETKNWQSVRGHCWQK